MFIEICKILLSASCFPNRTKFQVVFALDSSGSVTRPDYIRMREFAKTVKYIYKLYKKYMYYIKNICNFSDCEPNVHQ